jgi:hypothetical protein
VSRIRTLRNWLCLAKHSREPELIQQKLSP